MEKHYTWCMDTMVLLKDDLDSGKKMGQDFASHSKPNIDNLR
jgi:hypothetical protein